MLSGERGIAASTARLLLLDLAEGDKAVVLLGRHGDGFFGRDCLTVSVRDPVHVNVTTPENPRLGVNLKVPSDLITTVPPDGCFTTENLAPSYTSLEATEPVNALL